MLGSSCRRSRNPPAKRKRAVKKTADDLKTTVDVNVKSIYVSVKLIDIKLIGVKLIDVKSS